MIKGIENCHWPGRSQTVETERAKYFLDGAHTPKSMEVSRLSRSEVTGTNCCMLRFVQNGCRANCRRSRPTASECSSSSAPLTDHLLLYFHISRLLNLFKNDIQKRFYLFVHSKSLQFRKIENKNDI